MRLAFGLALLGVLGSAAAAGGQVIPKQIAAPPEQILAGVFDLPDPAASGSESVTAMLPIRFEAEGERFVWRTRVPIDDAQSVRLAAFGQESETWRTELSTPDGFRRTLSAAAESPGVISERDGVDIGREWRWATTHTVLGSAPGWWDITIESDLPPVPGDTHGYLFIRSASDRPVYTHLDSHDLLVGRTVGFETAVLGPAGSRIDSAEVEIRGPDGRLRSIAMETVAAQASAGFVPEIPGGYTAHVLIRGAHEDGTPFVRTSELVFSVVLDEVRLAAVASIEQDKPGVRRITLPLALAERAERAIVSAELWTVSPDGNGSPVCWLSRMAVAEDTNHGRAYTLYLDERWLAGVSGSLELRNARVQCCDTAVPLAHAARLPIGAFEPVPQKLRLEPGPLPREMLIGTPRRDLAMPARGDTPPAQLSTANGGHNLMLVHGYCAGGNPWPLNDFAGMIEVFSDPDQNRSHDEFANLLLMLGNNSKSFGIVGHSQGGAAALHLWTYYFSGLDWARGPRLIQSVGTPYQGTPLAGNLSILGSIFGSGCGSSFDLSTDGAALWLAGIPMDNRDDVYYWTTAPTSGSCNFLSGLVLSNPEDGVIESARGQLPGGNNMGLVFGWCHTTGMSQPAQYFDTSRNTEMNAEAAR